MGFAIELVCPECSQTFAAEAVQTFCRSCASPLLARYDFEEIAHALAPGVVRQRARGIWRWAEFLPVQGTQWRITLGEGDTPLLPLPKLGKRLGLRHLYLKDEARNPAGCFKARGIAVSLSRHLELGLRHFYLASAGNAGGTLAVYGARTNWLLRQKQERCSFRIYLASTAPLANRLEIQTSGAEFYLIEGTIADAAARAAQDMNLEQGSTPQRWFDLSTFKEPYRVEGKKTLGFELAEQFDYHLPDVILYPTGGGTGLIGMWKAFDELERVGWIGEKRPRMISVQAQGCAPIVEAFRQGTERTRFWHNAATSATGLCVPQPFADRLILKVLRESGGDALAVDEEEIRLAQQELAQLEGVFASPEGAATLAALKIMVSQQKLDPQERVVLFNTASGVKYTLK
ncbi:MAG: threonine synthase [Anaerolineales bacterium]|nr:threonine synthase [Anaerolineales bacterium]MDW8162083.1 threonine synthase [Anaerolineales bacterium]